MKQCSYCGTKVEDSVTSCPGCGAGSFSNVCPNCGKVYEHGSFCPVCGTNVNTAPKKCPRCGNTFFSNACPNCGYNSLHSSVYTTQTPTQTSAQTTYQPSQAQSTQTQKKGGCWKVLLWVLFFPIMATIAIWKSQQLGTFAKIILTIIVLGAFIAIGNAQNTENAATSSNTGLAAPVVTVSPVPAGTTAGESGENAAPASAETAAAAETIPENSSSEAAPAVVSAPSVSETR